MNHTYGLSIVGVLVAGLAGGSMGAGYGMLKDPNATNDMIVRRATGGALLVTGLYLWAPSFLREFWLRSIYE